MELITRLFSKDKAKPAKVARVSQKDIGKIQTKLKIIIEALEDQGIRVNIKDDQLKTWSTLLCKHK